MTIQQAAEKTQSIYNVPYYIDIVGDCYTNSFDFAKYISKILHSKGISNHYKSCKPNKNMGFHTKIIIHFKTINHETNKITKKSSKTS